MTEVNKYKYLSLVLGIIALLFAFLYFNQPDPTVGEVYENVETTVSDCSAEITQWQMDYKDTASSTEKQEALDAILENCQTDLEKSNTVLE
jgi:hypothetical protein